MKVSSAAILLGALRVMYQCRNNKKNSVSNCFVNIITCIWQTLFLFKRTVLRRFLFLSIRCMEMVMLTVSESWVISACYT